MKVLTISNKAAVVLASVTIAEHTYDSVTAKYGAVRADSLFEEKIDALAKSRIANAIRIAEENSKNPKHADFGKPVDAQAIAQAAADKFEPVSLRGEGDGTKRALGTVAAATARYEASDKGSQALADFLAAIQAATESVSKPAA